MELTLALITQDHGAVAEGAQGKVRTAADVASSCVVVKVMDHIPAAAQHGTWPNSDTLHAQLIQGTHHALTLHRNAY